MTLIMNLSLKDAAIAISVFFVGAFVLRKPFHVIPLIGAYLWFMSWANGRGHHGWLLHMLHYLQVGYSIPGFCIPKPITYDVF